MKDTNEPRSKEPQGMAAGASSASPSSMAGRGQQRSEDSQTTAGTQGSSSEQERSRESQDMSKGKESSQSQAGMKRDGSQRESTSHQMATTNGESQRQPQGQRSHGMQPRSVFESSRWMENPFAMMRRVSDEMDRFFDELWTGRGMRAGRGSQTRQSLWSPQIEMYEKDNQLVICTDLPGLTQEDIQLEVSDDMLTIQGERRNEFEDSQEGYYRSERSYGSFSRAIPLPEGVDTDNVKASFENGVLKVMVPLPQQQQQQRKRRIEVSSSSAQPSGAESTGQSSQSSSTQPRS